MPADPTPTPTPEPGAAERLAAMRTDYERWLSDPECYDPRAGGFSFIDAGTVADVLRDGLWLLSLVARLTADLAARSAEHPCGTCGRETLPDGDCYGCEADRQLLRAEQAERERDALLEKARAFIEADEAIAGHAPTEPLYDVKAYRWESARVALRAAVGEGD